MVKHVFIASLFVLLLVPSALALNVPDSQKKITLTLERGDEYSFNLLLKNLTARTDMLSEGNASEWIAFGSEFARTYEITNLIDQGLKITIFVPSTASIKDYETTIRANNETASTIYLKVIDNFQQSFQTLESKVSSLNSQIGNLKNQQDTMESRINEIKAGQREAGEKTDVVEDIVTDMKSVLNEVKSFQEDLRIWKKEYDNEKATMQSRVVELENQTATLLKENTDLTGSLTVQGTSLGLLLIIVIGGFVYYAYSSAPSGGYRPKFRLRRDKPRAEKTEQKSGIAGLFDTSRLKIELKPKEEHSGVSNFPKPRFDSDFKYKYRSR
ncbi:MAG: hypothetical protein ABIH90_00585 [Candidatus Aenigmatarchaeota archaeon]